MSRRAHRRQHGQSRRLRQGAGSLGRVRRGGRRLVHRHRQSGEPADHRRGRLDGLHQRADRRGACPPGAAQAPDRGADHGRGLHGVADEGDLMDYINAPIGGGRAPRGPLKPLIAVPTTAGTGSESTAMCVLDVLSMRVKTGISHWRLRPTLAVIDPLVSLTLPPEVTASAGMDIVCHALESYTARWYNTFERKQPEQRVTYCGSNPVSDLWCEKALALLAASFRTAFLHGSDLEARSSMMLAA